MLRTLALILALAIAAACEPADPVPEPGAAAAETPGLQNFIFFNRDRERIFVLRRCVN